VSPKQPVSIRTFYRIVLENPPASGDFESYFEMGKHPTDDPEWNRLASGYSVYSTLGYSRRKAKAYPWKSKCFIAELRIPETHPFHIERSGPKSKHYTIWGNGELLRSMILRVLPVREDNENV